MPVRIAARPLWTFLVYAVLAMAVVGAWEHKAQTERLEESDRIAQNHKTWNSIAEIAHGRASSPFVGRRLLVDSALLFAWAVPEHVWKVLGSAVERTFPGLLAARGWKFGDYPLLLAAHILIWASVLGFMYTARSLLEDYYECPPIVREVAGAILGVGLLGGLGTEFRAYPYDFTQAFIFALTMLGISRGRGWALPCFLLAAYSKETSLLLIFVCWAVATPRRSAAPWVTMVIWAFGYAVVRTVVGIQFDQPLPHGQTFWWPRRNLEVLAASAIYYMWSLPFIAVLGWRIWTVWDRFPRALRRSSVILVVLLASTFFKGWLEERRQYLEALPIVSLLVMQWLTIEFRRTQWMTPRQ